MKNRPTSQSGFTLLEVAIVLIVLGILAGGGVSLFKVFTEQKSRSEALAILQQARTAVTSFCTAQGRLPWADGDGDGLEDSGAGSGGLPYLSLGMAPTDSFKRPLRYEVNTALSGDRFSTCSAIRAGISGRPEVVDADGSSTAFPVAAVLVSAGPMDADSNGNVFDAIGTGGHTGNNQTGTPNYLRHPSGAGFDDLVVYVGANELFPGLCEYLALAVNNHSGATVYIHDALRGADIGSVPDGNSGLFDVVSGSRIELRSGSGGGGGIVASTPPTPIALAGRGATLDLP